MRLAIVSSCCPPCAFCGHELPVFPVYKQFGKTFDLYYKRPNDFTVILDPDPIRLRAMVFSCLPAVDFVLARGSFETGQ